MEANVLDVKALAQEKEDDLFRFVDNTAINSEKITAPRYSYWKSVFRVFFKKKINWVLIILLSLIILASFILPLFYEGYDKYEYLISTKNNGLLELVGQEASKVWRLSPSAAQKMFKGNFFKYCLGTGGNGESIFYVLWPAARTSLLLAVVCSIINMVIGIALGAVWGYSKTFDQIMMVIYNIVSNVPYILVVTVLVYIVGSGFWPFVFALTVTGWLGIAYFFRTQVLIIRDREYNLASKCLGTPITRVVTKNVLPFLTSVIVTFLAAELPSYISMEVFLSYIGIGLSDAVPSLGKMIEEGQDDFLTQWWRFWPPVVIASSITIVLYVVGQNLADASDPRTHR